MSIVNVSNSDVIEKLAKEMKKVADVKAPSWSLFAKTGCHTERPPTNPDWWCIRAASILVKIHNLGPVGVSKLRVKYGGKKNRGMAPERFKKSGGKIIRLILQQLEKAGLAKQAAKGLHKGRVATPKGKSFVEKVAYQIMKEENIVLPAKGSIQQVRNAEKVVEKPAETQVTLAESTPPLEGHVEEQKVKKSRAPRKPKKKADEVSAVQSEVKNE